MKSFASDNCAAIHPEVMAALVAANEGHALAYGDDPWTRDALKAIKRVFGETTEAFFALNGTGANVIGLQSMLRPYEGVFCTEIAHVNVDECGAAERLIGTKLIDVPHANGKLELRSLERYLVSVGNEHQVQPRVISLTQSTERGTIYGLDELRAIREYARRHNLFVHMDGARFANATAALAVDPREIIEAGGVDVLSFGGTKNGLMLGEAVLVFAPELAKSMKFHRKQLMQLSSKMRFIAAQFLAYLNDGLWLRLATTANASAKKLEKRLRELPQVKITEKVEANVVFAEIPRSSVEPLQKQFPFYLWSEELCEARLMCAWDTTDEDIVGLVGAMKDQG